MIFSARISLNRLTSLCRRLATATEAGVAARTIWAREAMAARGSERRRLQAISQAVNRGESLADALAATGNYFPAVFREMAAVGEATGHQPEVFAQLAAHYEHHVALRREFLAAIAWPMTQLAMAVLIVGLLIWSVGIIGQTRGMTIDPLGLGLTGNRGLAIYAGCVAAAAALIAGLVTAVRRGWFWGGAVQRALFRLPVLGPTLQTIALARLAWAMHLTLGVGMDVRRALKVSLQSARSAVLSGHIPQIDAAIARGDSIYEAFLGTGAYPVEFLDTLAVSEQSGRLAESLALLSRQYQERARAALRTLTMLAGFAVWAVVALLIIAVIFRLAAFYLGTLDEALKMR